MNSLGLILLSLETDDAISPQVSEDECKLRIGSFCISVNDTHEISLVPDSLRLVRPFRR